MIEVLKQALEALENHCGNYNRDSELVEMVETKLKEKNWAG